IVADYPPPVFDGYAGVPSEYDLPDISGGTPPFNYTISPSVPVTVADGKLGFTPTVPGLYTIKVTDYVGMVEEIPIWVPEARISGFSHHGFTLTGICRVGPGAPQGAPYPGYPTISIHNSYCYN